MKIPKKILISLISTVLLLSLCLLLPLTIKTNKTFNIQNIELSITKGIDFLHQNQLASGEFKTYTSPDKDMRANCYFDSSPFITTLVLYSITFLDNPRVKNMTTKAVNFFLQEMEAPGIWRFWTKRKGEKINPDLDDIACISYILKKEEIPFESNINVILANKNKEGLFYTWVDNNSNNDIDPIVNANVLLYLGNNENTKKICDYLNNIVLNNKEENSSLYYPDQLALYYMISRAYAEGINPLGLSKDAIINKIISARKNNGSFGNELSTALAICSLLNFKYQSTDIDNAIKYLLNKQMKNGSWPKYGFFTGPTSYYAAESYSGPAPYYGSEELTTAICIEALAKYRRAKYVDFP